MPTSPNTRDCDLTLDELQERHGPLVLIGEKWVDSTNRVRRINHTRANGDLMDEMEAGLLFHSPEDKQLTLDELVTKYGPLRLTEQRYYVDEKGFIRRILPYTSLAR
jgi:hypothetical protein